MRFLYYLLLAGSFCQAQNGTSRLDSLLLAASQSKTDSKKIEMYTEIAIVYQNINPEQGLVYGQKAIALAKKAKQTSQIAKAAMSIGVNYYNLGKTDKAKTYYTIALKAAKDRKAQIECYILIGKYYLSLGNFSESLKNNLKALKLSEEIGYEAGKANALYSIGITYNYLNNPKKAIHYFKKGLAINQKLKINRGIVANLHGLATQYEYIQQNEIAKKYYLQAKKVSDALHDDFSTATIYSSFGNLLFNMNEIESALDYVIAGRQAAERINNVRNISTTKFIEGRIYLNLYREGKKYKNVDLLSQSEKLLQEVIDMEKTSESNKVVLAQGYELLSEIYSFRKEYKKAKDTFVISSLYMDTIYSEDTKQTTKSLEDQRTIDLKNKEIEVNKLTLANKEKEKWFFITGILFLLSIGGLFFYQSIRRKKTNGKLQLLNSELDEANKTKTRFFSILNHDLRGPVSNLIHFLHLQKDNPELLDAESKKRMESKTIAGAENLLASMEDILLWSKGQMENFKPHPKKIAVSDIFKDTEKHFSGQEKVGITFQNEGNIHLKTDENYLKTILRNLTGNAIKALEKTENPTINWKAWQEGNHVYLSISDNGPGASQEQFKALYDEKEVVGIKSGLGLHLIRDLAKAIDCKITVDSKNDKGTIFTLQLPV